jgi:hypothetical protein
MRAKRGHCNAAVSLSLLVTTARRVQIRGRRAREARIIVVIAEAEIARAAQEAAHLSGRMTMIDAQWPVRSLADRARMSLAREDGPGTPARTARSGERAPCREIRGLARVCAAARCLPVCAERGSNARASGSSLDRRGLWHIDFCRKSRAGSRTGGPKIFAGQRHLAPNRHAAAQRAARATAAAIYGSDQGARARRPRRGPTTHGEAPGSRRSFTRIFGE